MLPGTGADVEDVVGDSDGVLVVLDDDQGVAHVPEPEQGLDQSLVVALVEPDRRLIEDVEHADEAGPDLGGEANALGLSPRQRGRRPGESQIVEPDVQQELDPGLDLLQHPLRDLGVPLGQL